MNPRIIPLNLPAGLEHETAGNPVTTRLESAVGNCYPGLELDIRNLDRRFFPGLIFEFVSVDNTDPGVFGRGAQLMAVDTSDPDVPNLALLEEMNTLASMIAGKTAIFLDALRVEGGERLELYDREGVPYNWDVTWRLVRSLDAKEVTIELATRNGRERSPVLTLTAKRRVFWNKRGEISAAYQPGELSQSLCSPWQHDFRDCGCTYWASNHPDITLPAHPATIEEAHTTEPAADRAEDPILWMRWNRSKDVGARETNDASRPFELDHYEINQRWRDLAVVLGDRERLVPWSIGPCEEAQPLDPKDVVSELRRLAGIEHALALEYLYARYSVRFEDPTLSPEDQSAADFIAHELLLIATSEMMHLRWANQLLWELNGRDPQHSPALGIAALVPGGYRGTAKPRAGAQRIGMNPPEERPIHKAIDDFIVAESPSGTIEGQYAKLLALLRQGLPAGTGTRQTEGGGGTAAATENRGRRDFSPDVIGLVERIMADGVTHYSRFREIKALLDRPRAQPLVRILRNLTPRQRVKLTAATGPIQVNRQSFLALYKEVISALDGAYSGRVEDRADIVRARQAMTEMDALASQLANKGIAVPLLSIGKTALSAFHKGRGKKL